MISTFVRVLIFIIQREKASRKKWTMRGDFFLSSKFLSLPYISVPVTRAHTDTDMSTTSRRFQWNYTDVGFSGWPSSWSGSSASVPFRVD